MNAGWSLPAEPAFTSSIHGDAPTKGRSRSFNDCGRRNQGNRESANVTAIHTAMLGVVGVMVSTGEKWRKHRRLAAD